MTTITAQVEAIIDEIAPACVDCSEHVVANRLSAMRRLAERLYPIIEAAEARAREEGAKAMEWPEQWPLGTRVRKRKGSSWQGAVVGYYSTDLTPRGYAVESEREPGSVQIYPKAALEALDPAQIAGGKP